MTKVPDKNRDFVSSGRCLGRWPGAANTYVLTRYPSNQEQQTKDQNKSLHQCWMFRSCSSILARFLWARHRQWWDESNGRTVIVDRYDRGDESISPPRDRLDENGVPGRIAERVAQRG